MGVRIITDSSSDVSQERAKEWGVTVIPLKIRFREEEYEDGVTLSNRAFYEKLVETDEIPKSSQIPPYEYESRFREAVDAGEEVVCLCLSSGVSGSYQSAQIAAEEFGGNVHVVDTRQFCIALYLLVQRAVQERDAGKGAAEIVEIIEAEKEKVHLISLFNTLEYLKMGGRISNAAYMAGSMLSIKPVISIEDGLVKVLGKARGSKNGNNMLKEYVKQCGGINFEKPLCLAYTGFSDETLQKYIADSKELYEGHEDSLPIVTVGATIGTYAGPGAIALAFF
ncbi:MAG: DegV family protein [Lachnospiraceae bacterium]|nr:DegV family protein [Lachnospiraceae bacterium]